MPLKLNRSQENEVIRVYHSGVKTKLIANQFGVSDTTIRNILRRNGIAPCHHNSRYSTKQDMKIVNFYESGLSIRQVACKVGCVSSTVSKVLKRNNISCRMQAYYKALSFKQSHEVVSEYINGATYQQLATKYKVSTTTISSCLKEFNVEPRTGWSKFKTEPWTDRKGETHVFKSRWELAYAKYLDLSGFDWKYEVGKFPLVRCRVYTPDFAIYLNDHVIYHEVKGWIDNKTMDRLVEFVQAYSIDLKLVGPLDMVKLGLIEEKYMFHPMAKQVEKFKKRLLSAAYCGRRIENAR